MQCMSLVADPIPIAQPQDRQEGLRAALGALPSVSSLAAGLPCAIFLFWPCPNMVLKRLKETYPAV